MITADRLSELLHYDPNTGLFTWRCDRPRAKRGDVAGCRARKADGRIYIVIRIQQRNYYAHRLAFLWMTGQWPSVLVDHENGDGTDNCWRNIRRASHTDNMVNSRTSRGISGYRGVWRSSNGKRWSAVISRNRVRKWLGDFATPEEAARTWDAAARSMHGEFAKVNFNDHAA